jgi:UDP-N-acetyl-D-glucosamine dehydrogenase
MSSEQIQNQRSAPSVGRGSRPLVDISTVAVVGLGYVGLPLAIRAASKGFNVIGFDIDEVKIIQLNRREANFLSDEENDLFARSSLLRVTSDEKQLDEADAFLICVPTPVYEDHQPDLRPLEGASAIVARHLKRGDLVVVESTVSPGVCEGVALKILCKGSGLSSSEFDFAHCPERINPGDERWDVRSIPRVMGGLTPRALERAATLYGRIVEGNILRMNTIKEAEAVKMVENAFRDINIAFVNELAISFDRAGIDIVNVIKGASTKPFGFMPFYPGCGVGGHCIPVDPYYLIRYGRQNGFEHKFLVTARRVNSQMPLYVVSVLERALSERGKRLSGSKVALLGLAYKREIPDTRESPALIMRDALTRHGAEVRAYDPYAPGGNVRTLSDALRGADSAIVATDHAELRTLTPRQFEEFGIQVVVDGRNCLQKEEFVGSSVIYRGVGRGGV